MLFQVIIGQMNPLNDTIALTNAASTKTFGLHSHGWWKGDSSHLATDPAIISHACRDLSRPVFFVETPQGLAMGHSGQIIMEPTSLQPDLLPLLGYAPAFHPHQLGDAEFRDQYHLDYAYMAGAMANGITSVKMVVAMAEAGMLSFFGAAGLTLDRVEQAIKQIKGHLGSRTFGMNLIHSPTTPDLERSTVDCYLKHGITLISASAFMDLTPNLVWYRLQGISTDPQGNVVCKNRIFAKISREEVARRFLSPPPEKIVQQLRNDGRVNHHQAQLAQRIPMCDALTVEADSGGHTDNRPTLALFPTMRTLCDRMAEKYRYPTIPKIGLAGGIGTPQAAAAAFAMGAAFILTGSVNQGCIEAGTSETVRKMLAATRQADMVMAPSADMFEMGVKVQVLKRGTMFPQRAQKLYDLYTRYDSWEEIPDNDRALLERDFFKAPYDVTWDATMQFFAERDPRQIERAQKDPRHKMALVFRSYLGQSSIWAITGVPERQMDYQIWCGPAMGAFNEWVGGTFLEPIEARKVTVVAHNLLYGAAVALRLWQLQSQNNRLSSLDGSFAPLPMEILTQKL